ncbi:MAG: hypothetical protein ACKOGA_23725, partial [Planctomycetaceae bacterium]
LTLVGLFADRADASCGDYVHVGNPRTVAEHGGLPGAPAARLGHRGGGVGQLDPQGPQTPCHGPHCRTQPSEPVAPAPVPAAQPPLEAWLMTQPVPTLENSLRVEFPRAEPRVSVSRRGPFRPPRAS